MSPFLRWWVLGVALIAFSRAEEQSGHLFILSGQSNMTGNVQKGFSAVVSKKLGKDATLVHHCKPGRGIRFWVEDYSLPEGHPFHGRLKSGNGEEFPKLVDLVRKSGEARTFKTVHLIWMQGESDANRDLGVAYERSFKGLIKLLKKELGVAEIHFVIGRISDFGLHGDEKRKGAWQRVREAQKKLAYDDPLGAWINTDDFIPRDEKTNQGNLHYPEEESVKLGGRFGKAALLQIAQAK